MPNEQSARASSGQSQPGRPEIVLGSGAAMRGLLAALERAAPNENPILIEGEAGTGKSLLARRVHEQSGRSGQPFILIPCRAAAEALSADIFGAKPTGSDVRRGALEAAGRGTVVLDDVVELPFSLQQELAQTLLTRRLRPPGSATELTLRTRIVATSRRDLRLETAQGRFSQDLYDKFGGQVFRVPPLRDRPEDILSVVEHWVALAKRRGDVPSSFTISSETVSALLNQDWAANASELEAAVEWALRAASRRAGGDLLPRDLPSPRAASSALTSEFDPALTYRQVRSGFEADFERRYVSWLLSRHQGNISAAAREARMDRKHLYDLARKHGLRQRSGGSPE